MRRVLFVCAADELSSPGYKLEQSLSNEITHSTQYREAVLCIVKRAFENIIDKCILAPSSRSAILCPFVCLVCLESLSSSSHRSLLLSTLSVINGLWSFQDESFSCR